MRQAGRARGEQTGAGAAHSNGRTGLGAVRRWAAAALAVIAIVAQAFAAGGPPAVEAGDGSIQCNAPSTNQGTLKPGGSVRYAFQGAAATVVTAKLAGPAGPLRVSIQTGRGETVATADTGSVQAVLPADGAYSVVVAYPHTGPRAAATGGRADPAANTMTQTQTQTEPPPGAPAHQPALTANGAGRSTAAYPTPTRTPRATPTPTPAPEPAVSFSLSLSCARSVAPGPGGKSGGPNAPSWPPAPAPRATATATTAPVAGSNPVAAPPNAQQSGQGAPVQAKGWVTAGQSVASSLPGPQSTDCWNYGAAAGDVLRVAVGSSVQGLLVRVFDQNGRIVQTGWSNQPFLVGVRTSGTYAVWVGGTPAGTVQPATISVAKHGDEAAPPADGKAPAGSVARRATVDYTLTVTKTAQVAPEEIETRGFDDRNLPQAPVAVRPLPPVPAPAPPAFTAPLSLGTSLAAPAAPAAAAPAPTPAADLTAKSAAVAAAPAPTAQAVRAEVPRGLLQPAQSAVGEVTVQRSDDTWLFTGTAGDQVQISADQPEAPLLVWVYDQDMRLLRFGNPVVLDPLAISGTYMVVVSDPRREPDGTPVRYTITLTNAAPTAAAANDPANDPATETPTAAEPTTPERLTSDQREGDVELEPERGEGGVYQVGETIRGRYSLAGVFAARATLIWATGEQEIFDDPAASGERHIRLDGLGEGIYRVRLDATDASGTQTATTWFRVLAP